jgi:hypothetical protein
VITVAAGGVLLLPRAQRVWPGRLEQEQQGGLVVAPGGLALVQGELRGELRWDEVRKVQFVPALGKAKRGEGFASAILLVDIPGSRLFLRDVHDQPLTRIHEHIGRHWPVPREEQPTAP